MFKRLFRLLFRLLIIFVILFFLNKYTTWFNDTKFGNFFNRFEDRLIDFLTKDESSDIGDISPDDVTGGLNGSGSTNGFTDDDIITLDGKPYYNTLDQGSGGYIPKNYDIVFVDHANQYCITPRGQRIENGNYIVAYKSPISATCDFEKRYCNGGRLEGSFSYHTCLYENIAQEQSQKSLLASDDISILIANKIFTYQDPTNLNNASSNLTDTKDIDSGKNYPTQGKGKYDMQTQVGPGIVASSYIKTHTEDDKPNRAITDINKTQNDPEIHFLGRGESEINIKDGKVDLQNNALKSSTLKKILKSGGPVYDSKYVDLPISSSNDIKPLCITPWGDILANGQYTMAFDQSASVCRSEIRYCIDGVLKGTYTDSGCNNPDGIIKVAVSPSLEGVDLNSYEYKYYKDTMKYTYRIADYYRWYNNIPLASDTNKSDIYVPTTNSQNHGKGCWTEQFGVVPDGTSVIGFKSNHPDQEGCIGQVRYCIDGVLQGEFPYGYCE